MKKLKVLACFMLCIVFLFSDLICADSIWNRSSSSPYSVAKSFKVGDIITIIILESTSAVTKAGTDTNANDSLSLAFSSNLESFYHPSKSVGGSGGNTYKGLGSTTRSSNVTAKVASVVVRVLQNGNLMIAGEHRVAVNDETQTIKISGVIRPKDVTLQNTVYSYQVAQADVSVKGKGSVGDAESPGIFTRFFNWIF